jgi:hypothetical protein
MNTSPLQFTQDGNLPVSELSRWTDWFLDALREPGASFRSVIAKFHAAFGHRITLSTFHRFHHDALAPHSPDKFVRKNLRSRAAQIVRHVVEEHLERWLETPPEDLTEIERGARIVAKLDALDFQHLRLKQQKKGGKRTAKTENAAAVLHPDFAASEPTGASGQTPLETPPQTTAVSPSVPPSVSALVSALVSPPVPTPPAPASGKVSPGKDAQNGPSQGTVRDEFTITSDPGATKALAELLKTTHPPVLPPSGMYEIGPVSDEPTLRALKIAQTIESLAAFHAPPAFSGPKGAFNPTNADAVTRCAEWAAITLSESARRRSGDAKTRLRLVRLNLDGAVSAAKAHWQKALEAFQEAEPEASALFDRYGHDPVARCSVASLNFRTAVALVRLDEPEKAVKPFHRTLSLCDESTDDGPIGLVLCELHALAEEWLALLRIDDPIHPTRENRIQAALTCRQTLARRRPGDSRHPQAIERLQALLQPSTRIPQNRETALLLDKAAVG